MSEPEIARRCTACGMTVRQRAMFCPQCGNPITSQPAAPAHDTVIDTAPTEALRPDLGATQPLSAVAPTPPEIAPTQALDSVPHLPARHANEDGVRARVEKLRKVSSVVIDQAAYDPSLRFLLVAAAFFLLFIVLLILSKVIG
jgi:hypothetical protein